MWGTPPIVELVGTVMLGQVVIPNRAASGSAILSCAEQRA